MNGVPERVGPYGVRGVIARGGMGVVLLADHPADGRAVAIKQVHAHLAGDAGILARFVREGRIAARLHHPNIVEVLDVGAAAGAPYLVMEFVAGGNLADESAREGRVSIDRVRVVAGQVCSALAYAHAHGVVHRDVTPRNLLLTPDGTVKVADFGIAHARDDTRLTLTGSVLGTARYLAPEQAAGGTATAASDLYSLGVVLYELLTGRAPYEAESLAALVLLQQTGAPPPLAALRPDVPPAIAAAITACLARDPVDRPPSASALAWQLGLGEAGSTRVAAPTALVTEPLATAATRPLPPPSTARRVPRLGLAVAAAGCALVGAGAVLVTRGHGDAPRHPASVPVVRPAPGAPTPADQARALARWLRAQSR